jgi:hypothetical protein
MVRFRMRLLCTGNSVSPLFSRSFAKVRRTDVTAGSLFRILASFLLDLAERWVTPHGSSRRPERGMCLRQRAPHPHACFQPRCEQQEVACSRRERPLA